MAQRRTQRDEEAPEGTTTDGQALLWLGELAMQQRLSALPTEGELRPANALTYLPPPPDSTDVVIETPDEEWRRRTEALPTDEEVQARRKLPPPRFFLPDVLPVYGSADVGADPATEALLREQDAQLAMQRTQGPLSAEALRAISARITPHDAPQQRAGQTYALDGTPNTSVYTTHGEAAEDGVVWDYGTR